MGCREGECAVVKGVCILQKLGDVEGRVCMYVAKVVAIYFFPFGSHFVNKVTMTMRGRKRMRRAERETSGHVYG